MLAQTLKTLYSPDEDIYSILNQSHCITKIRKDSEIPLLFHTGFKFCTHRGIVMDLYFDLKHQEIIRTPEFTHVLKPLPFMGHIGTITNTPYVDFVTEKLCVKINRAEADLSNPDNILRGLGFVDYYNSDIVIAKGYHLPTIEIMDAGNKKEDYSFFQIIEGEEVIQLPLRKSFEDLVFFDGTIFSEYNLDYYEENYYDRDYWK
ncbi:MAG: hypothetical protein ABI371_08235 [Gelidibacter sp.]